MDFYQTMTIRDVPSPTAIHFIVNGRQGILEARDIAQALHIPYEPTNLANFNECSCISQQDMVCILSRGTSSDSYIIRTKLPSVMLLVDVMLRSNIFPFQHRVQRRGVILEALFKISEGYYFGSHHLILVALLHFEEKVHKKRLQKANHIPLLFSRLLCHILEHMGYPTEPHLERCHPCREHFTLDKWTHLTCYAALVVEPPQAEEVPQVKHSTKSLPHALVPPMPEVTSTVPPPAPTAPTI